jgi:hypothetical protein
VTLKLDIEFVNKAAQRAKARAAEVAQHPHSRKISADSRRSLEKYKRDHSVRKVEHT